MIRKESNDKNVLIELQHIELELKNGRTQHLRHFIDQYYCYKNNHVNKNGRAKWEDLVWNGLVSAEACAIKARNEVVKEHVVPLKVITELLVNRAKQTNFDCDAISMILDKYLTFATISKEEDKKLRDAKLTSKMPPEFSQVGNDLFDDPLARYKIAGISLERQQSKRRVCKTA